MLNDIDNGCLGDKRIDQDCLSPGFESAAVDVSSPPAQMDKQQPTE